MRKIHHVNTNKKEVGLATLISDRAEFRVRIIRWLKSGIHKDKGVKYCKENKSLLCTHLTT